MTTTEASASAPASASPAMAKHEESSSAMGGGGGGEVSPNTTHNNTLGVDSSPSTTTHKSAGIREVDGKGPGKRLRQSSPDEESDGDGEERHKKQDTRQDSRGTTSDHDEDDDDDDEDDDDDDADEAEDGEEVEEGEEEEDDDDDDEEEEEGEIDGEGGKQQQDPPLPPGPPPGSDDGWQAIWDDQHQAYYFYNALTGQSTWTNPRVPEATVVPPSVAPAVGIDGSVLEGDPNELGYEPTYYQLAHGITDPSAVTAEDIAGTYAATGSFNRFTGKWQSGKNPEMYNDENKTRRQMEFYFDVDAAANSHDGRSLKAERQMKKLSKKELKAFREKRKEKKEQKRRAWLKD